MFTIQKIKDNFHLSKTFSFNENIGSYTETLTEEFSDFGGFCDIYIEEFNNEILQNQVDVFNNFLQNFKNYRGVNLVTYFNLFITNVFRFHKSFNDSMKDSLLMN